METDDVLMFCQNELPYNSFIAFEEMREKGRFCDLTIKVQNHSFTAHRMILAAGIPYFNSLYANNTVDTNERELTDADLDPESVESLIHFAYTSKINITIENVNSLLVASQFLQLNQVVDACVEFISKRLAVETVSKVHTFACNINNLKMIGNCHLYIRMNFEEFSKCADFLSLPHSCFKEIIADDDLIVSSEEIVFDAVMKWTKASPSERHASLSELLNEVRLIYIPVDYFVDRVDCEKLISSSEACRNLVNEVRSYHLLPERRSALSNLKMWPRKFWQNLFAFCYCGTCGYVVRHFVHDTWLLLSSKKIRYEEVMCVVLVNNKLYIFLKETIETFCITTHEWKKLKTKHQYIIGAAVVSYGDKIYCFGSEESAFKNKARCFDTKLNQWVGNIGMKKERLYCAAASLEKSIYVTGGGPTDYYNQLNAVEKYNPLTGQWSDVAPMLTERNRHGCTAFREKIYVCGGYCRASRLNTAEVYDPITNQWNYISSMAKGKSMFTLISNHHRIYALDRDDPEVYDPKLNDWKCSLNVPEGFRGAVSILSTYIPNVPD